MPFPKANINKLLKIMIDNDKVTLKIPSFFREKYFKH